MRISPVEDVIEDIKNGKLIILVDDEDRENEGDFVVAAQHATPEIINFMATHGRGLICLSLTKEDADRLALQPMKPEYNDIPEHTAFTIPIDAKKDVTTGISAYDRASTVKQAISQDSKPEDFIRPGHVFPLIARKGGVLVRAGHTEGSVDISRIAGLRPASVICEIMKDDGDMARLEDLLNFSERHNIKITTIADLIRYRLQNESFVSRVAEAVIPTLSGVFNAIIFQNEIDSEQHIAFVKGEIKSSENILVRVHSDFLIGDVFESTYNNTR
ncbi:MAG: 3,4-dihydroxy-2-butanone-4-phosphate synthase, partial [Thermodesulfobacteriota bacterium]